MKVGLAYAVAKTSGTPTTQAFTDTSLGGAVPKAALFFGSYATVDNTARDQLVIMHGACTGTAQGAATSGAKHNSANTTVRKRMASDQCMMWHNYDGSSTILAEAKWASFSANTVTVNWNLYSTEGAFKIVCILLAGDDLQVKMGNATIVANGNLVISDVGFEAGAVIHFTARTAIDDTSSTEGRWSLGFCTNDGLGGIVQRGMSISSMHSANTGDPRAFLSKTQLSNLVGTATSRWRFQDFTANGFTVNNGSTSTYAGFYLALKANTKFWTGDIGSPTSAQVTTHSDPNWKPQAIIVAGSRLTAYEAQDVTANAGSSGFGAATATANACVSVQDGDATSKSDTQSMADARLVNMPEHDGATTNNHLAVLDSFISTGFKINWTKTDTGSARQFHILAFEEEAVGTPVSETLGVQIGANTRVGRTLGTEIASTGPVTRALGAQPEGLAGLNRLLAIHFSAQGEVERIQAVAQESLQSIIRTLAVEIAATGSTSGALKAEIEALVALSRVLSIELGAQGETEKTQAILQEALGAIVETGDVQLAVTGSIVVTLEARLELLQIAASGLSTEIGAQGQALRSLETLLESLETVVSDRETAMEAFGRAESLLSAILESQSGISIDLDAAVSFLLGISQELGTRLAASGTAARSLESEIETLTGLLETLEAESEGLGVATRALDKEIEALEALGEALDDQIESRPEQPSASTLDAQIEIVQGIANTVSSLLEASQAAGIEEETEIETLRSLDLSLSALIESAQGLSADALLEIEIKSVVSRLLRVYTDFRQADLIEQLESVFIESRGGVAKTRAIYTDTKAAVETIRSTAIEALAKVSEDHDVLTEAQSEVLSLLNVMVETQGRSDATRDALIDIVGFVAAINTNELESQRRESALHAFGIEALETIGETGEIAFDARGFIERTADLLTDVKGQVERLLSAEIDATEKAFAAIKIIREKIMRFHSVKEKKMRLRS